MAHPKWDGAAFHISYVISYANDDVESEGFAVEACSPCCARRGPRSCDYCRAHKYLGSEDKYRRMADPNLNFGSRSQAPNLALWRRMETGCQAASHKRSLEDEKNGSCSSILVISLKNIFILYANFPLHLTRGPSNPRTQLFPSTQVQSIPTHPRWKDARGRVCMEGWGFLQLERNAENLLHSQFARGNLGYQEHGTLPHQKGVNFAISSIRVSGVLSTGK